MITLNLVAVVVTHWLHVLMGITWFGGVVYRNLVVLPILLQSDDPDRRVLAKRLKERADQLLLPIALIVIGLGMLRGTVFGQIQSGAALGTAYGITWIVGLIAALSIFAWDVFFVGGEIENWYGEQVDDDGQPLAASAAALALRQGAARIQVMAYAEIGGFLIVFTCMVLMRFGY